MSLYAQLDPKEVDLEYILYTDCDVLFEKAIDTCTVPPMPPIMYVGGEAFQDSIANTGEMGMAIWGNTCQGQSHAVPTASAACVRGIDRHHPEDIFQMGHVTQFQWLVGYPPSVVRCPSDERVRC